MPRRARPRSTCWISGWQRGVDGFRLDVANAYLHDAALADNPAIPPAERGTANGRAAANMQRHFHDSNLDGEQGACST